MLAEEGPRSLAMRALAATVYRRLVIFEREIGTRPRPNPLGLEIRALGADRLDEYERLRPGQAGIAAARLASGLRCYGSWLDGTLVAARWLGSGTAPVDYLALRLPLAEDEVYIFDSFTAEQHRGRGIAPTGHGLVCAILAGEGRSRVLGSCLPENRSAWRSLVKAGYEPAGKMGYVRLGPWRREFVRRGHSSLSTA